MRKKPNLRPRSNAAVLLLALVVGVPLFLAFVVAMDRYVATLPGLVVQRGNVLVSADGRVVTVLP